MLFFRGFLSGLPDSLFDGTGYAFHEALLLGKEEDYRGQGHDRNAEHEQAVVRHVACRQARHVEGHGPHVLRLHDDEGPHVVVPAVHEGDYRSSREGRGHDGKIHAQVYLELVQAVNTGRLYGFNGEGLRVLPEKEDEERRGHRRKHKAERRVQKVGAAEHLEQGHHDGCEGNHHGKQEDFHQQVLVPVAVNLKSVSCQRADEYAQQGLDRRGPQGIPQCASQPAAGNEGAYVLEEVEARNHPSGNNVRAPVGRGHNHEVKGKDGKGAHRNDEDIFIDGTAVQPAVPVMFMTSHFCLLP